MSMNPIANCIKTNDVSLQSWADDINFNLNIITDTAAFAGICHDNSNIIPIPKEIQALAIFPNKPYLYKNGLLIDPSLVSFVGPCPTTIQLMDDAVLNIDDDFVVFIQP